VRFPQFDTDSVDAAIDQLSAAGLLMQEGSAVAATDHAIVDAWGRWLPEASFHFSTKNAMYPPNFTADDQMRAILAGGPQPEHYKVMRDKPVATLPPPARPATEFNRVLLERRTHREFGSGGISLDELNELLSMVWGVTGHVDAREFGQLPRKTSPSGGSRHPGEVYVMALEVEGLAPGLYHYNCRDHCLERVRDGATRQRAAQYCVDQAHTGKAAALFLMTAMFRRTMWKYHMARAYRVVTLDAGHLAQTFCLVATAMGLAPFTTAALRDSMVEQDLGIDGINESILYIAGVGRPLADT
jgi:SagB-type dehydrogenase family enzyme